MFSFGSLLLRHGYWFLFTYVLAVGMGAPLPADPLLLFMGAMVGNHQYSFLPSLLIAVSALLVADILWYQLGRLRGGRVLGLLCKLSFEPDTCVRKTEAGFAKHGAATLLFAKFVPGIALLSVCLAGVSKIPFPIFLLADVAGCTLWASSYLLLGRVFHRQLDVLIGWLGLFGRRAGLVVLALLAIYVLAKYLQRRRFVRKLRLARITPQQALNMIETGQPVTFIDLRHASDVERSGMKIAGALRVAAEDLLKGSPQIPETGEIILYCT
ncbi:MAG: VTT domain-containing protein [Acidobacteriaceae bacterium]|nr:VTT domain-containing protein [Acidobacteriaceae bacterium]